MSNWSYLTRKQHRKVNNIPDWVPIGDNDPDFRLLWVEDDARPPDGESSNQAWERIFGWHHTNADATDTWDGGDSFVELHPGNRVYECSCGFVTIWQYMPPRKFD